MIWGLLMGGSFPVMARQASKTDEDADVAITVRVYDYVEIPKWLLAQTLRHLSFIMGHAGVRVVTVACTSVEPSQACGGSPDWSSVLLRIVPHAAANTRHNQLAFSTGPYITVDYSRVKEVANRAGVHVDRMLGCVAAHELGHVLLGSNSHSSSGIMVGSWTRRELKEINDMNIWFLPFQTKRMRANIVHQRGQIGTAEARSVGSNESVNSHWLLRSYNCGWRRKPDVHIEIRGCGCFLRYQQGLYPK